MNKRVFSFISLFLMFTMLVLVSAGCGVRINGKEYEFFSSRKNDKNNFNGLGEELTDALSIVQDNIDGEKLKLSISSGNIEITKSGDGKIQLDAEVKVRGASNDTKKIILDNLIVSLDQKGKTVEVVTKTKDGKDFWDWHKKNHKAYHITINYNISLPENIKDVEVSTGAGNIYIDGISDKVKASTGAGNIDFINLKAELSASTGAGNINVEDSSSLGESNLNTGAGNIYFMGSVDEMEKFKAATGMGNVDFLVPAHSKMTLDVDTGVGVLYGSFIENNSDNKTQFKGKVNGGGPSVKLSTGVGNITVDEN